MPAKFIPLGQPAHDPERQALRFLIEGLPGTCTVYGNPWLVDRAGVVYETDAIVVAPHAIFVVEMKAYRGTVEGTDYDWYTPHPVKSPIGLNRKTAQVLNSLMKRDSYEAGQIWIQGLVFLSAATACNVRGAASRDRIHTRSTILEALQNPELVTRLASRATAQNTPSTRAALDRILTSEDTAPKRARPARRIREYEVERNLETHDNCKELLARNTLSGDRRVLRIYGIPSLATDAERELIRKRARWEAQVLGRIGKLDGILAADPPFEDEAGIVLPLEHFESITLATWVDRYALTKKADFKARVALWLDLAAAIADAHDEGVVHRLLRPEVILVEDSPTPSGIRITGFDLAKQISSDSTVAFTTLADERLRFAAPEVINAFSTAEPASDQFSLGALLALIVAGRPLFESTRDLLNTRRLVVRLRDISSKAPLTLDEACSRMLSMRPADRFPDVGEAAAAVRAYETKTLPLPHVPVAPHKLDPDALEPGMRVGADYEIVTRLGHGGMATVYAARHLPSGRTRALKIAKKGAAEEEALRGEYQVLATLDHPGIVRVLDLTNMVESRLTLVMERVSGETLKHRLGPDKSPLDPPTRRRYAEDLLGALDYLEQQGITHKDLKPDNLLVGDGGLTVIDFSLASMPADAPYGGTALYRDPSRADWTHASDRYAAALCLFELYAGRHAFDGKVPEPGQAPSVRPEDIDPPGLAAFFEKALHRVPEQRFPSAKAMRDALLVCLGDKVEVAEPGPIPDHIESATSLRVTPLPPRAVNQLGRAGVTTVGELLGLSESQVKHIANLGDKTIADVLAFQKEMRARGLAAATAVVPADPAIVPALVDSPEPLTRLALQAAVRRALENAKLTTIGAVARLPRSQLRAIDGIGPGRLQQVVQALVTFAERADGATARPYSLDALWDEATQPLTEGQRIAVDRFIGVTQAPEMQGAIAESLGVHQSKISNDCRDGLTRLIDPALADVLDAVEQLLDAHSGIALQADVGKRLEQTWEPGAVTGEGIVRLLVRTQNTRLHAFEIDGVDGLVLARPIFDRAAVRSFVAEVHRLAGHWPPIEADSARRTLVATLPEYPGDPLQLATRLCTDVDFTDSGQLFQHPLDPALSIRYVLDRERDGVPLPELKHRVRHVFGERSPFPEPDHLLELLRRLECHIEDGLVIPGGAERRGVKAPAPMSRDPLPPLLGADRPPEIALRELLRDAATSRGFRMLVTPPEKHADIGRSVAAALGGTFVSFEDAFFQRHGDDIAALERAEQYAAQRGILTEHAEDLLRDLIEDHGRPGQVVVLGDTAILGLCDALDVPRRLYDETLSGSQGLWVLVVPGVIHNRQPRFNEDQPLWHLEGVTFPLLVPMPAAPASSAES